MARTWRSSSIRASLLPAGVAIAASLAQPLHGHAGFLPEDREGPARHVWLGPSAEASLDRPVLDVP